MSEGYQAQDTNSIATLRVGRDGHTLRETCAQLGIDPRRSIAMGDGSNDLKMMAEAGLSVAFRAKPVVREAAGLALNFVGLDGVLRLF